MIAYQWTSAAIGILLGTVIIALVRKDLLHTRYSFLWLMVALTATLLGFFPQVSDVAAKWLGVTYPPTLVMLLALVVIAVKILFMDIDRSRQEIQLRRLAHRLAILEAEMEHRKDAEEAKQDKTES